MIKEEDINLLAEKVLNLNKNFFGHYVVCKIEEYEKFEPLINMEHAWLLLSSFEEGLIRKRMNGINYRAWILHNGKEYTETAFTPNEAIINVALKACDIK